MSKCGRRRKRRDRNTFSSINSMKCQLYVTCLGLYVYEAAMPALQADQCVLMGQELGSSCAIASRTVRANADIIRVHDDELTFALDTKHHMLQLVRI